MKAFIVFLLLLFITLAQAQAQTVITSPAPFQIFQRSTSTTGAIWISGETAPNVEITGVWGVFTLPALYSDVYGHFEALWPDLMVWQHDLVLTIDGVEYTVENVGIGDVYVVAGQSNAMGLGRHYQQYISTLGFRAGMLTTDGWGELADPTGYVTDQHAKGSQWPLLATYILEYGVPVAFIPTARGSTSITQWQPGTNPNNRVVNLLNSLPAPYARAVLWQQGEADVNMTKRIYANNLETMTDAWHSAFNIPLFAALLYNNTRVNAGINIAISERPYILHGANLSQLPRDSGAHYTTDANLNAEAVAWWQALVIAGFYP